MQGKKSLKIDANGSQQWLETGLGDVLEGEAQTDGWPGRRHSETRVDTVDMKGFAKGLAERAYVTEESQTQVPKPWQRANALA